MRTILLTIMVAVLGMACQENDPAQPESPIEHVLLNEAAPFNYLNPYTIDFNQDGLIDFQFAVNLEYSQGAEHTKFLANSVRDSKILLLETTAMAFLKDKKIDLEARLDDAEWSVQSGELLVKTRKESGETLWSGSWQSNPEGFLGICFKMNGAYHYGWVKLLADPEHQEILVQEYAYHKTAGAGIMTGQKE